MCVPTSSLLSSIYFHELACTHPEHLRIMSSICWVADKCLNRHAGEGAQAEEEKQRIVKAANQRGTLTNRR